jgi:hypothetical protein
MDKTKNVTLILALDAGDGADVPLALTELEFRRGHRQYFNAIVLQILDEEKLIEADDLVLLKTPLPRKQKGRDEPLEIAEQKKKILELKEKFFRQADVVDAWEQLVSLVFKKESKKKGGGGGGGGGGGSYPKISLKASAAKMWSLCEEGKEKVSTAVDYVAFPLSSYLMYCSNSRIRQANGRCK